MSDSVTYCFEAEWFDPQAQSVRAFLLMYYRGGVSHGMIEMVDRRSNKAFVKKALYPALTLPDLFVGATVVVHGRPLNIVGYGDVATRRACAPRDARQLLLVLPAGYNQTGEALGRAERAGMRLRGLAMARLRGPAADAVAAAAGGAVGAAALSAGGDAVTAMDLVPGAGGEDGGGPEAGGREDCAAVAAALCAKYGAGTALALDGAGAAAAAAIFFGADGGADGGAGAGAGAGGLANASAVFDNCTLCLVRPSVVAAGGAGAVLDAILTGSAGAGAGAGGGGGAGAGGAAGGTEPFEVSAAKLLTMDRSQASELLDVYRDVPGVPYEASLRELASGPCLALQLRGPDDVVSRFREYCGPYDVEVARVLAPDSLRARFGAREAGWRGFEGAATNGVHCTDLPEDGVLECRYVFDVLP